MKKFLLLTIIALSMSLTAFAQAKKMSVKDYFLAIPTDFMKAEPAKRAAWIESEFNEDGYLSYNIPIKEVTGVDTLELTMKAGMMPSQAFDAH